MSSLLGFSFRRSRALLPLCRLAQGLLSAVCLLSCSSLANATTTTTTFQSPGNTTYTVPAGVDYLIVKTWGAGGGGSGIWNSGDEGQDVNGGASGGAGAYVSVTYSVTPGQSLGLHIAQGASEGNGGEASVITLPGGTVVYAAGGGGAGNMAGGAGGAGGGPNGQSGSGGVGSGGGGASGSTPGAGGLGNGESSDGNPDGLGHAGSTTSGGSNGGSPGTPGDNHDDGEATFTGGQGGSGLAGGGGGGSGTWQGGGGGGGGGSSGIVTGSQSPSASSIQASSDGYSAPNASDANYPGSRTAAGGTPDYAGGNGAIVIIAHFAGDPTPPSIASQPVAQAVNAGTANLSFSVTAAGTGPFTYQWKRNGANVTGATTATYTIATVQASHAGDYTVSVANIVTSLLSTPATLTVYTLPAIGTQPANQVVSTGGTATFAVSATANPTPTYQWRKNGTAISGQTNSTLALTNVQPGAAGNYDVILTNSVGSVTSATAVLAINPAAPVITAQPTYVAVNLGSPASFSVTAAGNPAPTYQWRKNGVAISGATTSTLAFTSTIAGDQGSYAVAVTNSSGTVYSNPAALLVDSPLAAGQVQVTHVLGMPGPVRVRVGNVGTTVTDADGNSQTNYLTTISASEGGGTSSVYSGQATAAVFLGGGSNPYADPNTHSHTYTIDVEWSNLQTHDDTYTDDDGNDHHDVGIDVNESQLYWGTITVDDPTPQFIIIDPISSHLIGDTFSVSATAYPARYVFNGFGYVTVTDGPSTGLAPVFRVLSGPATITGVNQVTVTGPGYISIEASQSGDGYNYSGAAASLSFGGVAPTPASITTQPVGAAVVTAGNSYTLSVAAAGTAPITYQWKKDGVVIPFATNTTLALVAVSAAQAGNYTVAVTNRVNTVTSSTAVITVYTPPPPTPTITSPLAVTGTVGSAFTYHLTSSRSPGVFQWWLGTFPPGVSLVNGTNLIQGTPTAAGYYEVQFHSAADGSWGPLATIAITINGAGSGQNVPIITTQPVSHTVAPGTFVNFTADATGSPPLKYQWYKDGVRLAGQNGTQLTILAAAAGDVGNYAVAVSNAVANTVSNIAALTVTGQPPPASTVGVLPLITSQPQNITVKSGADATFAVVATSPTPLFYQWFRKGVPIAGETNSTYKLSKTRTTDNGASFSVSLTNSAATIRSTPASLLVTGGTARVAGLTTNSLVLSWEPEIVDGSSAIYRVAVAGVSDHAAAVSPLSLTGLTPGTVTPIDIETKSASGATVRVITLHVTMPVSASPASSGRQVQSYALHTGQAAHPPTAADETSQWLDVYRWGRQGTDYVQEQDGILDEVMPITGGRVTPSFTPTEITREYSATGGDYFSVSYTPNPGYDFASNGDNPVDASVGVAYSLESVSYDYSVEFDGDADRAYGIYRINSPADASDPSKWDLIDMIKPSSSTHLLHDFNSLTVPLAPSNLRLVEFGLSN